MQEQILPVEAIQERDVDLILLEELSVDDSFCEWFISELGLPEFTFSNGAWRSISDFGLGETDILFSYNSSNERIFVLIENKLDASFQNEQYNRYKKRAIEYLKKNECDKAFCVLVAPELFCENQNDFENYISYEAIAKRFQFTGSPRHIFKSKLLKIAAEKLRRGYQPVNNVLVQKFWYSYWLYKEEKFPGLIMRKPGIVPLYSDWPMLFDESLNNIVFYHKLGQGNVDATFKGFPEEVEYKIKENLPVWATFEKHNKNFSIRIFSGRIDRTKGFSEQIETVEAGLQNIERIRKWIIENKGIFQ